MKRILSGIAAAAVLMTSIAGTSLADTMPQTPFSQPQQRIEQSQMTPPATLGQQNQGGQSQMTPPATPGQQNQGEQSQMTPPAMPGQQNQRVQNQMTPPAMPGQQNQGEQSQMTPPAMPGQQSQGEQNQMTPPAMLDQQNQEGQNPTMTVHTENGGRLNMREEPNMGADVIGRYQNGTQVEILEVGDEWVKVSINGKTGYMAIRFLEGDLPADQIGERPEMPADQSGERPEMPADQNGERPELPGNQSGERPEMPGNQSGERPEMPADQNGERPELPGNQSGERPEMPGNQSSERPEMPADQSGERPELPADQSGERPEMPAGQSGERPEMPGNGQMPGMPGGMSGNENVVYAAAATVTESSSGAAYSSTADGENAVLVQGSAVSLNGATVTKTGSTSGENADFTGVNAAVLATNGANLTIEDASVMTDGTHANGVFSYGSGTTVNVSNTTITTSGNNSGGLMTTGGATLNASNLTVSTSGNSSAAIRSDRGGGTVTVTSGSYDTTGVGSPAIYSTADITVSDATLSASNSEAVVIEGGTSVTLENVDITGSNAKLNGQSTQKTNVLIYQSMSGDASEGNSTFTMTGGTMTAETGSMFHVTNVTTTITLEDVAFTYASDSDVFLDASADSWGSSGKNGGNVTLNLVDQDITGAILSDSISSVTVNLDSTSSWTLTGDSYVSAFNGDLSNVNLNGYTLYVNGVAVSIFQ